MRKNKNDLFIYITRKISKGKKEIDDGLINKKIDSKKKKKNDYFDYYCIFYLEHLYKSKR